MMQSHEKKIKLFSVTEGFLRWFVQSKCMTYWRFSVKPEKVNLKIPIYSGWRQAGIARPQNMALGCWFHQILFWDSGLS
jgi:hypothetical protein